MRTYLDCVPCFVRQALEAARMATDNESVQKKVLWRALRDASDMDVRLSPPAMGKKIDRLIRGLTGDPDPYRPAKERTNGLAMVLYSEIRGRARTASNPLQMAVRMAIAGNIIDFAVNSTIWDDTFRRTLDRAATEPPHGDVRAFADEAAAATSILYVADNVGEIVFDRVLTGILGPHRVTVVVRGKPVLNDLVERSCLPSAVSVSSSARYVTK